MIRFTLIVLAAINLAVLVGLVAAIRGIGKCKCWWLVEDVALLGFLASLLWAISPT